MQEIWKHFNSTPVVHLQELISRVIAVKPGSSQLVSLDILVIPMLGDTADARPVTLESID
jgi:hypothetical protein